jgi:hypothetical protein
MKGHDLKTGRSATAEEKYQSIIPCRVGEFRENRHYEDGTFVIGYYYYYYYYKFSVWCLISFGEIYLRCSDMGSSSSTCTVLVVIVVIKFIN